MNRQITLEEANYAMPCDVLRWHALSDFISGKTTLSVPAHHFAASVVRQILQNRPSWVIEELDKVRVKVHSSLCSEIFFKSVGKRLDEEEEFTSVIIPFNPFPAGTKSMTKSELEQAWKEMEG